MRSTSSAFRLPLEFTGVAFVRSRCDPEALDFALFDRRAEDEFIRREDRSGAFFPLDDAPGWPFETAGTLVSFCDMLALFSPLVAM